MGLLQSQRLVLGMVGVPCYFLFSGSILLTAFLRLKLNLPKSACCYVFLLKKKGQLRRT